MDREDLCYTIFLIVTIILAVILILLIINALTTKCLEYEDLCYKKVCLKTCWDKPVSCSDNKVIGHKEICVLSKGLFLTKDRRIN